MAVTKIHDEFKTIELSGGSWHFPPEYAPGSLAEEKILSGDFDFKGKKGSRTRLLRFFPGFITSKPFVHDYWEEVLLIEGDMTVGHDGTGKGGEKFSGLTYAVRPPGAEHGPFMSEGGALLMEIHYYDPA